MNAIEFYFPESNHAKSFLFSTNFFIPSLLNWKKEKKNGKKYLFVLLHACLDNFYELILSCYCYTYIYNQRKKSSQLMRKTLVHMHTQMAFFHHYFYASVYFSVKLGCVNIWAARTYKYSFLIGVVWKDEEGWKKVNIKWKRKNCWKVGKTDFRDWIHNISFVLSIRPKQKCSAYLCRNMCIV